MHINTALSSVIHPTNLISQEFNNEPWHYRYVGKEVGGNNEKPKSVSGRILKKI